MSKKEILVIVLVLAVCGGCAAVLASEAQKREAELQEIRAAWVGHPVYARVETGWTSPDVVIEGVVIGWSGEHALIKNIHDGTIHPVYMSHFQSR